MSFPGLHSPRSLTALLGIVLSGACAFGAAPDKSGVSPNTVSLPSGPGSIEGLGESFEPTLNTGTAKYGLSFSLPPGPSGSGPNVGLAYEGGNGNNVAGFGWRVSTGYIQRQTDQGIPRYVDDPDNDIDDDLDGTVDEADEVDRFLADGGGELVPTASGHYFAETEGEFVRYQRSGQGWLATMPDGSTATYGTTADSRIESDGKVFAWHVDKVTDLDGNVVSFHYSAQAGSEHLNQKYLRYIRYGAGAPPWTNYQTVGFVYESRLDWFEEARPGFLLRTGLRLKEVRIGTHGWTAAGHAQLDIDGDAANDTLARKYLLGYRATSAAAPWSLLETVTPVGHDGTSTLPASKFGYTVCNPASTISAAGSITGGTNEPAQVPGNPLLDFVDANGDGLPDILKTDAFGGSHTLYVNKGEASGKVTWANVAAQASSDGLAWQVNLEDTQKVGYLADMDGDGLSDLTYTTLDKSAYYFPNTGESGWGNRTPIGTPGEAPPAPFSSPDVKTADLDFDKRIDIIQSQPVGNGVQYRYWLNLDGQTYTAAMNSSPAHGFDFAQTGVDIVEWNGDRVPDVARIRPSSVEVTAGLGLGQFADLVTIALPATELTDDQLSRAKLRDLTGDGLADLVIERASPGELWFFENFGNYTLGPKRTLTNMPTGISANASIRWADLNGNGTTDLVYCDPEREPRMQMVDIGRLLGCAPAPHLLNRIENGIGGITHIEYGTSVEFALADAEAGNPWPDVLPFPVQIVRLVINEDGLGNSYTREFAYHEGYYDGTEKEFRGFAEVQVTELGDASAPTLLTRHTFDVGCSIEAMKGRLLQQSAEETNGDSYWSETTTWDPEVLYTGTDGQQVVFPQPTRRLKTITEKGVGAPKTIESEAIYDNYGNLTESREYGVVEGANRAAGNDERLTTTTYAHSITPALVTSWKLRYPVQSELRDLAGTLISRSQTYYDDETFATANYGAVTLGRPTLVRSLRNATDANSWVITARSKYDTWGNPTELLDPLAAPPSDLNRQEIGHYRTITYDTTFHTFPISETIHVGGASADLVVSVNYNYALGTVTNSTDFNGHIATYGYDVFGRLTTIAKPGDNPAYPSAAYSYMLNVAAGAGRSVNYVETRALDKTPNTPGLDAAGHYFISRAYVDGMGRALMQKTEHQPEGAEAARVAVSGVVGFNARGGAAWSIQPFFSALPGNLDAQLAYESVTSAGWQGRFVIDGVEQSLAYAAAPKQESVYDALMRPCRVVHPDGNFAQTIHEPLVDRSYDENDVAATSPHFNTPMVRYSDGLGRLTGVDEITRLNPDGTPNASLQTWATRYQYRADDLLTRIIDSQNNQKWMTYDALGRKTFLNDADRGVMNYEYDAASNLVKTVDAKSQVIRYAYDGANRLLTEDYRTAGDAAPATPDVTYHYDTAFVNLPQGDNSTNTATNVIGKLAWVKDLSGEEHTSYDARGNALYVIKRIPDPVTGVMVSYKTAMAYDAADRVKTLTYPDLDTSDFEYDARSLVKGITGGGVHNLGGNDHILASCTYLPSGQRKAMGFGNSVQTTYAYDERMRLNELKAVRAADLANPLMHYGYEFDRSLNITKINDLRPGAVQPEGDPLRNTQTFTYDDLYRLTSVKYSFNLPVSSRSDANDGRIDYRYDPIGNMLSQTSANLDTAQTPPNEITNLGTMSYGGNLGSTGRVGRTAGQAAGPHALTNVANGSRVYPYDDNGNMTNIDGLTCEWDFLDRMTGAENDAMRAEYTYDYTGRRITKKVWNKNALGDEPDFPTLTTLYINQNFEVREGGQPTKYVFLGDTRIARIIGTLNPAAQRMQRVPLAEGWNLVALCVEAESTAASQLGIGTNASIGRVYKWNGISKAYDTVTGITPLPRGTILWVEALADTEAQVIGSYSEPTEDMVIPDGSRFATNAALLAMRVDDLNLALKNQWEYFGPYEQSWASADRLADGGVMPEGVDFVPVGAAVAVRTPKLIQVENRLGFEKVNYYVQDHVGSTINSISARGGTVEEIVRNPFGNNRNREVYIGSALGEAYGYSQKEQDRESGIYYSSARYLTTLGNFVSVDPLIKQIDIIEPTLAQTNNPYRYALANPINYVDPTGLAAKAPPYRQEQRRQDSEGVSDDPVTIYKLEFTETDINNADQFNDSVEALAAIKGVNAKQLAKQIKKASTELKRQRSLGNVTLFFEFRAGKKESEQAANKLLKIGKLAEFAKYTGYVATAAKCGTQGVNSCAAAVISDRVQEAAALAVLPELTAAGAYLGGSIAGPYGATVGGAVALIGGGIAIAAGGDVVENKLRLYLDKLDKQGPPPPFITFPAGLPGYTPEETQYKPGQVL